MNEEEKERLIKKDIASIENRVRHAFNQGYEMGLKERKNTCEDAISRQAAIDALTKTSGIRGDALKALYDLPSVKPQEKTGRWIPVSERLPDKDKYIDFYKCLVAVSCTSRNDICDSFTAYFDGKHFYRHLYDRAIISGIKAWMPLPEPYKAESEG